MCDKLGGRRRNVFVAMFGKSVLTKHLERVCDLVREMQLKSLVRCNSIFKLPGFTERLIIGGEGTELRLPFADFPADVYRRRNCHRRQLH